MQNTYALYHNVGYVDRALRIGVGAIAILLILALPDTGTLGWLALIPLIAVYPILTGLFACDPVYAWVGIDTSRSSVMSDHNLTRLLNNISGQGEPVDEQQAPFTGKDNLSRPRRNAA